MFIPAAGKHFATFVKAAPSEANAIRKFFLVQSAQIPLIIIIILKKCILNALTTISLMPKTVVDRS